MARKRKVPPQPAKAAAPSALPHEMGRVGSPGVDFVAAVALLLVGLVWSVVFIAAEPVRRVLLYVMFSPETLVGGWFGDFQQPIGFFDRSPVIGVAAVLLLASHELGLGLLRAVKVLPLLTRLERAALAIGAGLNLVSLYVLLVGLVSLLHFRWLIVLPLGLAAGATLLRSFVWAKQWYLKRTESAADAASSAGVRALNWTTLVVIALTVLFTVLTLLGAMLPPWDFDVREYHLQVPKEWWQEGRVTFLPHNVYGNMPLGAEMQALAAMAFMPGADGWWLGALAGKLTMACYVPLTALLLVAAGRRWFTTSVGCWGALIFVSHPWMVHTAVSGLNEPTVSFYVLAALYALCLAPARVGTALLSGFFAGAAAACKYPAMLYAVLPLGLMVFALPGEESILAKHLSDRWRETLTNFLPGRRWFIAGAFAAGVLLGCAPWYAKNAALTGNPVYPLAYNLFGGTTRTPEKNARWERAHQVPRTESGDRYSLVQLRESLRTLFLTGRNASPVLLPLLLIAAAAAVVRRLKPAAGAIAGDAKNLFPLAAVLLLLFITAVWWLATHRIERFWLAALPLAALLAARAIHDTQGYVRGVLIGFTFLAVLFCGLADASPMVGDNRWFVTLAALRDSGISPARRWLSEHTPPGESVLLVGDAEPFDLIPNAYYNTCFDDCLLAQWSVGRSARERREALASRNIAFIYVDWNELGRYLSPGNYGYDPRWTPELLSELIEQRILTPVMVLSDDGRSLVPMETPPKPGEVLRPTIYRVTQTAHQQ